MELGCTRKVLISIPLIHRPTGGARICAGWCQDSLMWVGSQLLRAPWLRPSCLWRVRLPRIDSAVRWGDFLDGCGALNQLLAA